MFERMGHIITSSMQGHFSICCAAIVAAALEIVITGTLRNCCDRGSERESSQKSLQAAARSTINKNNANEDH
jgi:hypothetical protein